MSLSFWYFLVFICFPNKPVIWLKSRGQQLVPCPVDLYNAKTAAELVDSLINVCEQVDIVFAAIFFSALRVTATLAICTIAAVVLAVVLLIAAASILALLVFAVDLLFRLGERLFPPLVVRAILLFRRRPIGALALDLLERNAALAN